MRIIGVAGLALLAACGQPSAQAPAAEVSAQAKAAEPAAIADAPPSPPSVVVTPEGQLPPAPEGGVTVGGWGAIRIGMTLEQLNAATSQTFDPSAEPDYEDYQCALLDPDGAPEGLSIMYVRGRVARIDVWKPGVATYGGLQVGDPATKARAALGAALNAQPHFYKGLPSEYLTVWTSGGPFISYTTTAPTDAELAEADPARGVRFETDDAGNIEHFYAGDGAIELPEGCL